MIGHVLRRVRDAFAPGAAERRFRVLEAECRALLEEFDAMAERIAVRHATEARRKARETARTVKAAEEVPPPPVAAPVDDIQARKQAIRDRVRSATGITIPRREAVNESPQ